MLLRFQIITVTIFPALIIIIKKNHGAAWYEKFISVNPSIFNLQIIYTEKKKLVET